MSIMMTPSFQQKNYISLESITQISVFFSILFFKCSKFFIKEEMEKEKEKRESNRWHIICDLYELDIFKQARFHISVSFFGDIFFCLITNFH